MDCQMPRAALWEAPASLLGQVRGGVESGDRVLGQQESQGQHVEPEQPSRGLAVGKAAAVVDPHGEDVGEAHVAVRNDEQDQDNRGGSDDVPPHGDVVQHRHQMPAQDVQDGHRDHDEDEYPEDPLQRVAGLPLGAEGGQRVVRERRAAVTDRRDHGPEPDEVEPAGVVPRLRPTQRRGPPVDAARGRIGRDQFGQTQPDDQDERRNQRPADRDRDRTAVVPCLPERGETPSQDRDHRERDREVREPAPVPAQLLGVPEFRQAFFVGVHGWQPMPSATAIR